MILLIAVVAIILLLSGFFSGTEAALVSINDADVEAMLQQKRMGSTVLARVQRAINRSLITIVVFNNIVNIAGSIIVGQLVIRMYGDALLAVITTALTFGIIIFSEIIPKSLGIHYAERVALATAPIILLLNTMALPLIQGLEGLTNVFKRGEKKVGTEQQIRSLVTIGRRSGHIESDEGQLIHRAFILNDKTAEDIMTPLKDIIGVNDTDTILEASDTILSTTFTRYPVYGASIHDIEGILMNGDLLRALHEKKQDEPVSTIMRDSLIVEADMRSDRLLSTFRDEHKHLAVVQKDDHTVGIVTLEDVLEELVGEIEDETDVEN